MSDQEKVADTHDGCLLLGLSGSVSVRLGWNKAFLANETQPKKKNQSPQLSSGPMFSEFLCISDRMIGDPPVRSVHSLGIWALIQEPSRKALGVSLERAQLGPEQGQVRVFIFVFY